MIRNLENLKERIKGEEEFNEVNELILFLSEKRLKIVGNDFRQKIGIKSDELDKDEIIKSVDRLNEIAKKYQREFNIPNNWEYIEKFLRLTIVDDLSKEFDKQKK